MKEKKGLQFSKWPLDDSCNQPSICSVLILPGDKWTLDSQTVSAFTVCIVNALAFTFLFSILPFSSGLWLELGACCIIPST